MRLLHLRVAAETTVFMRLQRFRAGLKAPDPPPDPREQEPCMIGREQQRRGSLVRAAGRVGLVVSLVSGLVAAMGAAPALADVTPQTGPNGALAIAQAMAAPSTT